MLDSDLRRANSTATKIRSCRALSASAIRTSSYREVWLFHRREVMIGSPAKTSQGMKLVHPFRCQPLSIPSARIPSLPSFSPSLFSFLSAQVLFIAFLSPLILLSFSYYCLLLLSVFDSSTKWDEVVGMYSRDLILRFSPIIGHSIFIRIHGNHHADKSRTLQRV